MKSIPANPLRRRHRFDPDRGQRAPTQCWRCWGWYDDPRHWTDTSYDRIGNPDPHGPVHLRSPRLPSATCTGRFDLGMQMRPTMDRDRPQS